MMTTMCYRFAAFGIAIAGVWLPLTGGSIAMNAASNLNEPTRSVCMAGALGTSFLLFAVLMLTAIDVWVDHT